MRHEPINAVPRPGTALEVCRILPERWLVLRVSGSERALARLPHGPREQRTQGGVSWTLVDGELDGASLDRYLSLVGEALGAATA